MGNPIVGFKVRDMQGREILAMYAGKRNVMDSFSSGLSSTRETLRGCFRDFLFPRIHSYTLVHPLLLTSQIPHTDCPRDHLAVSTRKRHIRFSTLFSHSSVLTML